MNQNKEEHSCTNCRKNLEQGLNVMGLQEGVLGPHGFIPLEDMALFCCEECLRAYLSDMGTNIDSNRIP